MVKDLILDLIRKPGIVTQKYKKLKSVVFWLDFASDLSSYLENSYSRMGGFWEFSLVWGSKIQLN